MVEHDSLQAIGEHWHAFLLRDAEARLIVNAAMGRTGRTEQEVLFFLLHEWAAQNVVPEQRPGLCVGVSTMTN